LAPPIESEVVDHLEATLPMHISDAVAPALTDLVIETTSHTIPAMLEGMLRVQIVSILGKLLTNTLTRSVTHAVAPAIALTLQEVVCQESPLDTSCTHSSTFYRNKFETTYYVDYYSAVFSDHASQTFTGLTD
jgi:hypothetical protein